MPYRPKTLCKHPGCGMLVEYGQKYCAEHKSTHPEYTRASSKRGYNSAWQKASKTYLREHPLCVECLKLGRYTQAMVVDHINPHRGNKELFWNRNNWQSLCKPCHDSKTGREDSLPTYKYD